jgi:3-methylcrotonyl-CoA carboxylase alpha subunit
LYFPAESAHLRIDTGVRQGDRVAVHYDPLLAKLLARGADREEARRRLQRLLGDTLVAGVSTNLDFLAAVLAHPDYAKAEIDTGFIERHRPALFAASPPAPAEARLWPFCCSTRLRLHRSSPHSADPWSLAPHRRLAAQRPSCRPSSCAMPRRFTVVLRRRQDGWLADLADGSRR